MDFVELSGNASNVTNVNGSALNVTGFQHRGPLKYVFPFTMQIGFTTWTAIVFITSLIGNITVIHIIRTRSRMRNSTNILIANMAVADLLMTFDLLYILKWLYVFDHWFPTFMGTILCQFFHSAQAISIAASVFSLVAISVDRSLHILFPMKQIFANKVIKLVIAMTWICAVALCAPVMMVTKHYYSAYNQIYVCNEDWSTSSAIETTIIFHIVFLIVTWIAPLLIISTAYTMVAIMLWIRELPGHQSIATQRKVKTETKKATVMLITVAMVFGICWAPMHITYIVMVLRITNTWFVTIPIELESFMVFIGYSNSAINPILYVIFSENFRREFKRVLFC